MPPTSSNLKHKKINHSPFTYKRAFVIALLAAGVCNQFRWIPRNSRYESMDDFNLGHPDVIVNVKSKIPRNLIFNSKDGIAALPNIIQMNIHNNIRHFPGWNVISDDDSVCLDKITQLDVFSNTTIVSAWYQSVDGMYKSDLCRLAQLYLDGGLYLDNDVELTTTLSQGVLVDGVVIVSSLVFSERFLFQAILASPPGHPLIKNSLEKFKSHIDSGQITNFNIGPRFLMSSLREVYNITPGRIDRRKLLENEGVYLMKEALLDLNHTMMKYRTGEDACNVAIEGIPLTTDSLASPINFKHVNDSFIYGFSRVIRGRSKVGKSGLPCSDRPFDY